MKKVNWVLKTGGDGLWSGKATSVTVLGISLPYVGDNEDYGELCVHFDEDTWEVENDGLIYTDSLFIEELRDKLNEMGLAGADADYSEQGMQGDDYVSLDVGKQFVDTWKQQYGPLDNKVVDI